MRDLEALRPFFSVPKDTSPAFDARVEGLAHSISAVIEAPVHIDKDMNYNAGQGIELYLTADGNFLSEYRFARMQLKILISSRGPMWTVLVSQKDMESQVWTRSAVTDGLAGNRLAEILEIIANVMSQAGFRKVPEDLLETLVPGQVTELDGLPATVRDLLFCELC